MSDAFQSISPRRSRRADRYGAQAWLWRRSSLKRVRHCGRVSVGEVAVKVVTRPDGSREAGYGGLSTCSSVWACPVCSAKIAARRAGIVADVLRAWKDKTGGRVVMATFTVRHREDQSLEHVWDAVGKAWRRAYNGPHWRALEAAYGTEMTIKGRTRKRIPLIRVVEVTHGDAGWHVHVHALLLVDGSVTDPVADLIYRGMWQGWNRGAVAGGLDAGDIRQGEAHVVKPDASGADIDPLAGYFTKAVYELTLSRFKVGRRGNRAPFEVLAAIMNHRAGTERVSNAEHRRNVAIWHEYEQASSGRHQIRMSLGLLDWLDLKALDVTDEDIAAEALDGDIVSIIGRAEWDVIWRRGLKAQVLDAFELSDEAGMKIVAWAGRYARFEAWAKLRT